MRLKLFLVILSCLVVCFSCGQSESELSIGDNIESPLQDGGEQEPVESPTPAPGQEEQNPPRKPPQTGSPPVEPPSSALPVKPEPSLPDQNSPEPTTPQQPNSPTDKPHDSVMPPTEPQDPVTPPTEPEPPVEPSEPEPSEPVEPPASATCQDDEWGIRALHPSVGVVWCSNHWHQHGPRILDGWDELDSSRLSRERGVGTVSIDEGIMMFSGRQPRLYLDGRRTNQRFLNVEATMYFRRGEDASAPYAGAVFGVRSGPEGHTEAEPCSASTYYGRLRYDGTVDVAKEILHPITEARAGQPVWPSNEMPYDIWIGVKFVVRNTSAGGVSLRIYRDLTEGVSGGDWQEILHLEDNGGWTAYNECGFSLDHIITDGGGAVFLRNTHVSSAYYKWVSVREIAAE